MMPKPHQEWGGTKVRQGLHVALSCQCGADFVGAVVCGEGNALAGGQTVGERFRKAGPDRLGSSVGRGERAGRTMLQGAATCTISGEEPIQWLCDTWVTCPSLQRQRRQPKEAKSSLIGSGVL